MEHELTSHLNVVEFAISFRFVRWEIAAPHMVRKSRLVMDDHHPDLFPTLVRRTLHCLRRTKEGGNIFLLNELKFAVISFIRLMLKKKKEKRECVLRSLCSEYIVGRRATPFA